MQASCASCRQVFEIADDDLKFYAAVSPVFSGKKCAVPAPTLCPDCRMQRRFVWRNERHLAHRKSDLSGKQIISNFRIDAPCPVYDLKEWWSDRWSAFDFGRPFDFSRPFFDQFSELQRVVPQLNLSVWNSENSDYCNYVGNVKDSYLIFGSVYSEDCYYGSPYYSQHCIDTLVVRECQWCYECIDCRKLYESSYCQDCHSSRNLLFCYDLQGCADCIGCAGLRHKQYHIFNQPYSKAEYFQRKEKFDLCKPHVREQLWQELTTLQYQIPHRFMQSNQVENVSGNYIYQSKNVHDSFYADRSEDCRFVAQVVDLKNCYDTNFTEEDAFCYEYLGAYQVQNSLFSKFCNRISNCCYADSCFTAHDLFGCIGVRNAEYCILNTRYSKAEYEKLVLQIVEHMRKTGEWGEFFPAALSPFGYNETVAQEYFPLEKERALQQRFTWYEEQESGKKYLGPEAHAPEDIRTVDESVCGQILLSETDGNPYKIIPQELQFYQKFQLPVPRRTVNERHQERQKRRNPRKLWDRRCAKCDIALRTSYAPERPELVYCEACYFQSVS